MLSQRRQREDVTAALSVHKQTCVWKPGGGPEKHKSWTLLSDACITARPVVQFKLSNIHPFSLSCFSMKKNVFNKKIEFHSVLKRCQTLTKYFFFQTNTFEQFCTTTLNLLISNLTGTESQQSTKGDAALRAYLISINLLALFLAHFEEANISLTTFSFLTRTLL